ncbi:MAG: hypothetical protein IPK07_16700 [Deltaproteobacteria bacterium]|jgi:hypothetical protein|nr:hypothetical protein [Deltaproteobacteria bacterium]
MGSKVTWLIVLAFAAFIGFVVWSAQTGGQTHCQVCMTFGGLKNCAAAAGPTIEEAERAARTAACATISNGVTESIQCEHEAPTTRSCSNR